MSDAGEGHGAKKRPARRRKPKAAPATGGDAGTPRVATGDAATRTSDGTNGMAEAHDDTQRPMAPEDPGAAGASGETGEPARRARGRRRGTAAPRTEPAAALHDTAAPSQPAAPAPGGPATPRAFDAALPAKVLIRVPMDVRWRDLDAFNHVNNSKYLTFLEEARLQWMMTLPGQGLDEHVAPVVAAAQLNYRRPIEWPAQVVVELFVERLGNSSVTVGHRILADAPGAPVLYCDGHVVMVWIDRGTGTAAPLPAAVREACAAR